jgi:Flp pilus assembly protein TadD
MNRLSVVIVAAMLGVPAASAATQTRNDPYAHDAIEAGNFGEAEASLRAQLALEPSKPELLLNLAAIYARTNRLDAAQTMYDRAMQAENVSLLLKPDVALDSHAIAKRGMAKLERQRMAAR